MDVGCISNIVEQGTHRRGMTYTTAAAILYYNYPHHRQKSHLTRIFYSVVRSLMYAAPTSRPGWCPDQLGISIVRKTVSATLSQHRRGACTRLQPRGSQVSTPCWTNAKKAKPPRKRRMAAGPLFTASLPSYYSSGLKSIGGQV